MKIVCPSCEANYEVPEGVVAARRQVRCARCGNDWVPGDTPVPAAVAAEPAPDAAIVDEPTAAPAPAEAAFSEKPAVAEPPPVTQTFANAELSVEPPLPASAPPASMRALPPAPVVEPRPATRAMVPTPAAPRPDVLRAAPPLAPRQPVVAWVVSILVIGGAIGAGVVFRAPVMKAWPPSTRLYAAVGLYTKR